jgi:hypothetical protein
MIIQVFSRKVMRTLFEEVKAMVFCDNINPMTEIFNFIFLKIGWDLCKNIHNCVLAFILVLKVF